MQWIKTWTFLHNVIEMRYYKFCGNAYTFNSIKIALVFVSKLFSLVWLRLRLPSFYLQLVSVNLLPFAWFSLSMKNYFHSIRYGVESYSYGRLQVEITLTVRVLFLRFTLAFYQIILRSINFLYRFTKCERKWALSGWYSQALERVDEYFFS